MRLTVRHMQQLPQLMLPMLMTSMPPTFKLERRTHNREMMARAFTEFVDDAVACGDVGLVPLLNGVAAPGTMGPWVCHSWE